MNATRKAVLGELSPLQLAVDLCARRLCKVQKHRAIHLSHHRTPFKLNNIHHTPQTSLSHTSCRCPPPLSGRNRITLFLLLPNGTQLVEKSWKHLQSSKISGFNENILLLGNERSKQNVQNGHNFQLRYQIPSTVAKERIFPAANVRQRFHDPRSPCTIAFSSIR